MTENERFELIINGLKKGTRSGIWDNQKQHNMGIGDELWLGEVVAMLNEGVTLAEENKKLQERNNRQAKQLDNLYTLIEKQDWKTLTGLIQEFQECEEQLRKEWGTYGDVE